MVKRDRSTGERKMSEVRNIKDGLVNKVVEDFTDYAIHTHYYFSNGVDLIVCRELYPFSFLFLRTNNILLIKYV